MTRIALFVPALPDRNSTPLLGPLYLLAALERKGFDGRLFDERIDPAAFEKLMAFRPDIAGVSTVTPCYPGGVHAASKIKSARPELPVIFGGPHPTALPVEVASERCVDYVVVGEGEIAFPELCERLRDGDTSPDSLRKIKNLAFKNGDSVELTDIAPFIDNLDALPRPAFHRMDLERYFQSPQAHGLFSRGKRILTLMSTRGCPSTCTFCCRVMGSRIRARSVASVMDEIHFLIDEYNIDELYIEDDNFTVQKPRALEILESIARISPPIHLKFANGLRADRIDRELLEAMKKARVYSLSFGIETGCPATITKMKKRLDLGRAKETVLLARSMGFLVGANCIIGYPGETESDVEESLNYFLRLPLDSMAIVNLVPFPGTEAREICEKNGWLTPAAGDWNNYYFSVGNPIVLIDTPMLPAARVPALIRTAFRRMYLRPRWIWTALRNVTPQRLLMGFLMFLGRNK